MIKKWKISGVDLVFQSENNLRKNKLIFFFQKSNKLAGKNQNTFLEGLSMGNNVIDTYMEMNPQFKEIKNV